MEDGSRIREDKGHELSNLHWASLSSSSLPFSTLSARGLELEPSRSTTYTCTSGCSQSSKPSVRIAILDPSGDQAAKHVKQNPLNTDAISSGDLPERARKSKPSIYICTDANPSEQHPGAVHIHSKCEAFEQYR